MTNENRSSFTGKIGFVLAAAGSAVGLGNIWRFPYLAAKYGGGIFLLVYILLAITFGFALMIGEIALGRKTGLSAIGAFSRLNKKYSFIGYLASLSPMIILPYYCVIGGWVTKYLFAFGSGGAKAAAGGDYFGSFISKTSEPVVWFLAFLALTAIVVILGVEKGVEKVSKVMMPVLVILSLAIAIYTMFMPGAMDGVMYYIKPDFSRFSVTTVLAAMGQLFYSMSLAMGIMITYGSYMKKDVNIESSVKNIEIFDTGIAFLAGLMIVPAAYVFNSGNMEAMKAGPSLMFITLPQVFDTMRGGTIIGFAFFLLVFFAALTSSISLMETVVSIFCDKLKLNRKLVCLFVLIGIAVLGLPSCFGFSIWSHIKPLGLDDILTFFDFISNSVLMPIVALLTCIFIGFVIKPKTLIDEVETEGAKFKQKKMFTVIIKYIAPIFILLILISSVFDAFGVFGFKF
ncbi:MAG: sodium-dependent transporter [Clostridia bacterium]|nr:sodium-dependent transporter [Clostridia bacterium]